MMGILHVFVKKIISIEKGNYTWGDLYDNAIGKTHLSSELKAKDEARYQTANLMAKIGLNDPEEAEIQEEAIEQFCNDIALRFDKNGNIRSALLKEE